MKIWISNININYMQIWFFSRSHHFNKWWLANKKRLLRWKIVFKRCVQGSHCECYGRISNNDTDGLVPVHGSGNGRVGAVDSGRIYRDQESRPPDKEDCYYCKLIILTLSGNCYQSFLIKYRMMHRNFYQSFLIKYMYRMMHF